MLFVSDLLPGETEKERPQQDTPQYASPCDHPAPDAEWVWGDREKGPERLELLNWSGRIPLCLLRLPLC